MSKRRPNMRLVVQKATDPNYTADGRRANELVEILRERGVPMSNRELVEITGLHRQSVRFALDLAINDGRVGRSGTHNSMKYFSDPDITPTLVRQS